MPSLAVTEAPDEDWLKLDDEPKTGTSAANRIVPDSPKTPAASNRSAPSSDAARPQPKPSKPQSTQVKQPTDDPDELRLAPVETPTKSSPSPAPTSPNKPRSVFDDDLPDLIPLDEPPPPPPSLPSPTKGQPTTSNRSKSSTSSSPKRPSNSPAFDDGLPDIALPDIPLAPLDSFDSKPTPSKSASAQKRDKPMLVGSLEELSLESNALDSSFAIPVDEEFGFPCKVCGTLIYTTQSRVGKEIRCPDCFSEFSVPSPPPKKKKQEVKLDPNAGNVTFAPIDAHNVRSDINSDKTKEILDHAKVAIDRERKEIDDVSVSFDSRRWVSLIFGFLRDPLVVAATVLLGLFCGAWFFAMAAFGTLIEMEPTPAAIVRCIIFIIFCVPILGSICMCGLAIFTMAANRLPRVDEWPFSRLGEAFGESMMVVCSLIAASIPGGMLGAMTNSLNAHPLISIGLILISIWAITPFLLLCMIDNGSIFEPFSKAVMSSFKVFAEAWGAMYMQTAVILTMLFSIIAVALFKDPIGDVFLGLVLPFCCFFIFNQYGVLAGRISPITEMGFEGDFSDDE